MNKQQDYDITLYIDADGCPVIDESIQTAGIYGIPVIIVCDESHYFQKEGAATLQVAKGPESVDIALMNKVKAGDIIITQDYGLAAMCLGKKAIALNQDGYQYTNENIEGLLLTRHENRKMRQQGKRVKGPKKRLKQQDEQFIKMLVEIIRKVKTS